MKTLLVTGGAGFIGTNLDIARQVCDLIHQTFLNDPGLAQKFLDCPSLRHLHPETLIDHVSDRAGHDRRYAINATKIRSTLGYPPGELFKTGLQKTIDWYFGNQTWWYNIIDRSHL
jgi:dTDP-glucose 4,6-dehydratase